MRDYGKISWQSTKRTPLAGSQLDAILELCAKHIPHKTILKAGSALAEQRAMLHEAYKEISEKMAEQPFLVAFFVWVQEIAALHPDMMQAAKMLLEQGFIGVAEKKKGKEKK